MEILLGLVLGAGACWLWSTRREQLLALLRVPVAATAAAADPAIPPDAEDVSAEPEPAPLPPPAARLRQLAQQVAEVYDNAAHPSEIEELPAFEQGAALLASDAFGPAEVLRYLLGPNGPLACMAAVALSRRAENQFQAVAARLDRMGWFTLYFTLRYLAQVEAEHKLGAVLIHTQEWWIGHDVSRGFLDAFVDSLVARGDDLGLGPRLAEYDGARMDMALNLLNALNKPVLGAVIDELRSARGLWVDQAFLAGIGRLRQTAADTLIEPRGALLEQLEDTLRNRRRSVLLVGPDGVGKTSLVELLQCRLAADGWLMFQASAAEVAAGQKYVGELEGRVAELLQALAAPKRVVWYVPDFHELLEQGAYDKNPRGLLDLLLPALDQQRLLLIGETTPEAHAHLLNQRPKLRYAVETVRVAPLSAAETLRLAEHWSEAMCVRHGAPVLAPGVLAEAAQLAGQYLGSRAAPGALMQLLTLTLQQRLADPARQLPIGLDDVLATLARLTGLPPSVLDDRERLEVASIRAFFRERVIGQDEAVEALIDRISMLKAGLIDPNRPIGVFLFAGPTGTGKTELAKTAAEFLFGAKERLLRLDMSEYQSPDSYWRLLEAGGPGGGKSLVSQIREQPFSVVLLDEFEKAHPKIWDLFLQVFDDGRLSDQSGRGVDFRHALIILTSNLGATIQRGPGLGFVSSDGGFDRGAVERAIYDTFRREFVNRLDQVLIFQPLSRAVMRDILAKELNAVLRRKGFRNKDWAVEWEPSALDFLLEKGFTADLGARPLRRAIERYLLAPLARTIVEHRFPQGDQFLFVASDGEAIQVGFIDPDAPAAEPVHAAADSLDLRAIALEPSGAAAEAAYLQSSLQALSEQVESEAWRAGKQAALAEMARPDFWSSAARHGVLARIELMDRIESALHSAGSLARRLTQKGSGSLAEVSGRLAQQLYLLQRALADLAAGTPQDAYLSVEAGPDAGVSFAELKSVWERLLAMYRNWAKARRMQLTTLIHDPEGLKAVLAVSGFAAFSLLADEQGLHVFEQPAAAGSTQRLKLRVRVAPQPIDGGGKPIAAAALEALKARDEREPRICRRYREAPSPLVRDNVRGWRTGRVERVLGGAFDLVE